MSRAALLPTIGDPLLLNLWFRSYEQIWKNEVDNAYVLITSDVEKPVREWIINLAENLGWKVFHDLAVRQHGSNITTILNLCEEDEIVLLEDDVFILQSGKIEECFSKLNPGVVDCIGSTRLSATPGLVKKQVERFNLTGYSPEHRISDCPHLWPSLFFSRKEALLKTDQNFCATHWEPGTYLKPLDWTTSEVECGDTFVWTSIQLRELGYKFGYVHQHHAGFNDIQDFQYRRGFFASLPPWVHFGSLSSGICDMLRYENYVPLANSSHSGEGLGPSSTEASVAKGAADELCRRVAMYHLVSKHGKLPEDKFGYYNDVYKKAVERSTNRMQLNRELISKFLFIYENLLQKIL